MNLTQLPDFIEPIDFSARNKSLQGLVKLADLTRLEKFLLNNVGEIQVELKFGKDDKGWLFIKGDIKGNLDLICQRCLLPMQYFVNVPINLSPVTDEKLAENLPADYEPILMIDEAISLLTAVEDELLLSLPLVAKHPENVCQVKLPSAKVEVINKKAEKPNPFKVLEKLKSNDHK